jgi:hypothetical protein
MFAESAEAKRRRLEAAEQENWKAQERVLALAEVERRLANENVA